MQKKSWLFIAFILVALSIIVWIYMYSSHKSEVVLINKATERVQYAEIGVCNRQFKFFDIKPGESRKIIFSVKSDSHYTVVVEFESKRKIVKELGYVTSGLDFHDTIQIEDSDIKIYRRTTY